MSNHEAANWWLKYRDAPNARLRAKAEANLERLGLTPEQAKAAHDEWAAREAEVVTTPFEGVRHGW